MGQTNLYDPRITNVIGTPEPLPEDFKDNMVQGERIKEELHGGVTALHSNLKSLGQSKTDYPRKYDPSILEKFPNPQVHTPYVIDINAPEFTSLCPKTGQPDYATILVKYSPDKWCVESKSFKLYLGSFRQTGAFHEDITNKIAKDLYTFLEPHWVEVKGQFTPRGGISFHPTVRLSKENDLFS